MIFHDVDQNTDEWLAMRAGKLTSSKLGTVMANYGKAFGEPAKKYAVDIAIEQITGKPVSSGYSNAHMDRGHDQEPLARMKYEEEFFCDVLNGGFFDLGFIGCSPDGRVSDSGLIEIKSVIPSVHYANIKRANVDPAYKWQCIGNLKFSEYDWIDFVSYCDNFPEDKKIFVYRLHRYDYGKEFQMINERIEQFKKLVIDASISINDSEYSIIERGVA